LIVGSTRATWARTALSGYRFQAVLLIQVTTTGPQFHRCRCVLHPESSLRPSASAGICGPGRGCKPEPARVLSFISHFDSSRRSRPAPYTRVGAPATLPSYGMSSTIWTSRLGTGPRQIGSWRKRCPATGLTSRDQAIRTARVFLRGRRLPTRSARFNIWAIRSPLPALAQQHMQSSVSVARFLPRQLH